MEALLRQLRALPARLRTLPGPTRLLLLGALGLAAAVAIGVAVAQSGGDDFRYAFTNLAPEDGAEVTAQLQAAGIPFRLEADGTALSVPAAKVYDVRLLLAAAGLPRGGGVGFELFDRGDLGISEFTQRVNLRRAIEGELARTIGSLAAVRSARVHLTLAERGLYRDEDRAATASVVLNLRAGRILGEREIAGVQHLVAAAVPGLLAANVTVVDGTGLVLSAADDAAAVVSSGQRRLEQELESRVVGLLEPAVGAGAVVARVNVTMDSSEVNTRRVVYDPDTATLRSERRTVQRRDAGSRDGGGVAGAAANDPLAAAATVASGQRSSSDSEDEIRNFEISQTTTQTVAKGPRLERLSLAILVDGADGAPRSDAELARLGELAKRAVGFDAARGDDFEISSVVFGRSADAVDEAAPAVAAASPLPPWAWGAGAAALLALPMLTVLALRGRRQAQPAQPVLRTGATVAEIEGEQAQGLEAPRRPALADPEAAVRERARELASRDPARAAYLIRAWLAADAAPEGEKNG
ncbi:flagellar basal-body MS-ring/collar protein FliF [Vulgatibacter sp.]|uniref:flagellar basal-body MS-ring/collar protein FliF n=1 Tax=Vulgatibacter sp. TaxID=1971226 RepID=UPI0035631D86